MGKIIFWGLLVGSLGLNVYLYQQLDREVDAISFKSAAIEIPSKKIPQKRHDNNIKFIESEMNPKTKNIEDETFEEKVQMIEENEHLAATDYQQAYTKIKKRWSAETRSFMERDLGLAPEVADFYFDLSEKRQKEIDDYIAPKVDPEQNSEPYMFTIEDNIAMAKINEKYVQMLKAAMGEDNYRNYKKHRTSLNKKLMEEGHGYFWVEY